jgi:hypothetical protein
MKRNDAVEVKVTGQETAEQIDVLANLAALEGAKDILWKRAKMEYELTRGSGFKTQQELYNEGISNLTVYPEVVAAAKKGIEKKIKDINEMDIDWEKRLMGDEDPILIHQSEKDILAELAKGTDTEDLVNTVKMEAPSQKQEPTAEEYWKQVEKELANSASTHVADQSKEHQPAPGVLKKAEPIASETEGIAYWDKVLNETGEGDELKDRQRSESTGAAAAAGAESHQAATSSKISGTKNAS